MKLTKSKLNRLIKEELENVLLFEEQTYGEGKREWTPDERVQATLSNGRTLVEIRQLLAQLVQQGRH